MVWDRCCWVEQLFSDPLVPLSKLASDLTLEHVFCFLETRTDFDNCWFLSSMILLSGQA